MFSLSSPMAQASPSEGSESDSSVATNLATIRASHMKTELERLSIEAVERIMRSDLEHPMQQIFSQDLKSSHNGIIANVGRDALYAHFARLSERHPNQRTSVIDAVADVDERRGRAKVWMTVVVTGLPGGLQKEGISLFCWERRNDKWMCWKHVGMGGVQYYT